MGPPTGAGGPDAPACAGFLSTNFRRIAGQLIEALPRAPGVVRIDARRQRVLERGPRTGVIA